MPRSQNMNRCANENPLRGMRGTCGYCKWCKEQKERKAAAIVAVEQFAASVLVPSIAPRRERTIKAAILVCPTHGYYAIAFDDRRITSSKCCGSWKVVREWTVPESELLTVLAREKSA